MIPQPLPITFLAPPPLSLLPIDKPHKDELYAFNEADERKNGADQDSSDQEGNLVMSPTLGATELSSTSESVPTPSSPPVRPIFRLKSFRTSSLLSLTSPKLSPFRPRNCEPELSPRMLATEDVSMKGMLSNENLLGSPLLRPADSVAPPTSAISNDVLASMPVKRAAPTSTKAATCNDMLASRLAREPIFAPKALLELSEHGKPAPTLPPATTKERKFSQQFSTLPTASKERNFSPSCNDQPLNFGPKSPSTAIASPDPQLSVKTPPSVKTPEPKTPDPTTATRRTSWLLPPFRKKRPSFHKTHSSPFQLHLKGNTTGLGLTMPTGNAEEVAPPPTEVELPMTEDMIKDKEQIQALSWNWGASAERAWGPSRKDDINVPLCPAGGGSDSDSGSSTSASSDDESADESLPHPNCLMQYRSVERKLLPHDDPCLERWKSFIPAYIRGDIDINFIPKAPFKGAPDAFLSPDATPLRSGPFLAPEPEWEKERQLALNRLQLDIMPQVYWKRIQHICDEAKQSLGTTLSLFTVIDEDQARFRTISPSDYPFAGSLNRSKTMCAHALLNRNDGMAVLDIQHDWRWKELDHLAPFQFYAAMSVCSADGFPIAILCCLDEKPRNVFYTHERKKLRDMATAIGAELEAWSVELFNQRMKKVQESWKKLEKRLSEKPFIPAGVSIGPRSPTATYKSRFQFEVKPDPVVVVEMQQSLSIDPRQLSTLGLTVTRNDIGHFNFCAKLIAETIGMETVYLAAVESSTAPVTLLGNFGLPKPQPKLEPMIHFNALDTTEGGLVYQNPEKAELEVNDPGLPVFVDGEVKSRYEAGVFCPIEFQFAEGEMKQQAKPPPAPVPSIFDAIPVRPTKSGDATTQDGETKPPLKQEPTGQRRVSTKKSASLGFVLVAMTTDRKRVIGIEDLRYLQGFAQVLGCLMKKCLHSMDDVDQVNGEAIEMVPGHSEMMSSYKDYQLYVAAGKRALKATQGGLTTIAKGIKRPVAKTINGMEELAADLHDDSKKILNMGRTASRKMSVGMGSSKARPSSANHAAVVNPGSFMNGWAAATTTPTSEIPYEPIGGGLGLKPCFSSKMGRKASIDVTTSSSTLFGSTNMVASASELPFSVREMASESLDGFNTNETVVGDYPSLSPPPPPPIRPTRNRSGSLQFFSFGLNNQNHLSKLDQQHQPPTPSWLLNEHGTNTNNNDPTAPGWNNNNQQQQQHRPSLVYPNRKVQPIMKRPFMRSSSAAQVPRLSTLSQLVV